MRGDNIVEEIKRNLPLEHEYPPKGDETERGSDTQGGHPIHGSTSGNNYLLHKDTQTFRCFRCKSWGDVIDMVAIDEGIITCEEAGELTGTDFIEALEIAADRADVDLDWDEYDEEEMKERRDEWVKIQEAYETAVEYWKDNLTPEIKEWIEEKYGFDEEAIERHDIGFAPGDGDLFNLMKSEVDEMTAIKSGLIWQLKEGWTDFFQGRVVFPYKFRDDYIYFIARKTPWTDESEDWQKGKYLKQLTPEKYDHVSDQVSNALWGLDTIRGEDEVIITEGIADAISLAEWGYPVLSPVTVRFKKDDIEKVKRAVRDKTVYICNDNDQGGFEGALDTLEEIENSYLIQIPEDYPEGYDVNDFFKDHEREDFEELKSNAMKREEALAMYKDDLEYLFRAALKEERVDPKRVRKVWNNEVQEYEFYPVEHILSDKNEIREAIAVFRRTEKTQWDTPTALEGSLRKRVISGVIERDMKKGGKFLYDRDREQVFYFNEKKHEVFNLQSADARNFLKETYGLNVTTSEGEYVHEDVMTYGAAYGKETKVRKYFHYDTEENVLYIHNRNDHIYKLDGEEVEIQVNGEEEYFITTHKKKINYIEPEEREYPDEVLGQISDWKDEGNFLQKVLVNRTNFTSKTALTAEEQRLQFLVTVYMFPFNKWFSAKPIISFIGQKGSGKSYTLRTLGRFLTYPDYELATLPQTEKKDFMVTASNNPLYFLDNVGRGTRETSWLNDALASAATGVAMKERQYYTNFGQAEAKIRCFLATNSRDPVTTRDDVVDRMLLFYVERIEESGKGNLREYVLDRPLREYWDTLWSDYIDDLNEIVRMIGEVDMSSFRSDHRLVDWVVFAKVIGRALDLDEEKIDDMIDHMKYEKDAFSLSDDSLLKAIRKFAKDDEYRKDRWYSANDLHECLCEVDEIYANDYSSSQSLAKRLPHVKSELSNLVGLRQRYNKKDGRNEYRFSKKDEDEDDESKQSSLI